MMHILSRDKLGFTSQRTLQVDIREQEEWR
jgi:hypothetical protein